MRVGRTVTIAAAVALAAALACGDAEAPRPTSPTPAAAAPKPTQAPTSDPAAPKPDPAAGAADYATFCATCHGATGNADTLLADNLDPRPARHSDGHAMNGLSDAHLFRVIKEGGVAVGKSPLMAGWGGALSDAQIRDLVAYIRTLADPPYSP